MAFNRIYKLIIADASDTSGLSGITSGEHTANNLNVPVNNILDVSGLDIEFNITRSMTATENTGEFNIFNAKQITRNAINQEGLNILFQCGYQDEGPIGTLFIGNLLTGLSRREEPNWITQVTAQTMLAQGKNIYNSYLPLSYSKNTPISIVLQNISVSMGYALHGIELTAGLILDNGYVFAGSLNMALKNMSLILKANQLDLYIDNSDIVIYKFGSVNTSFGTVNLNYSSGLLGVHKVIDQNMHETPPNIASFKKQAILQKKGVKKINLDLTKSTVKKIQFESLIIPQLTPNGLVEINNSEDTECNGIYVIQKINFTGNNFGGDSKAICEASTYAI